MIAVLAIIATAETGCDRGPKIGPPDHITRAGDAQTAEVGSVVSLAPSVVILDENDRGVPGLTVTFTVTTGGGFVENPTTTTDESGTASAGSWTLGMLAGVQSLRASSPSVPGSPVTFTASATPGAAVSLTKVGVEPTASPAGFNIDSIVVIATDRFGNAVPDQVVTFTVTAGGGTVSPSSRTTLADGRAATRWTLGPDVDVENRVTAARGDGSLAVVFSSLSTRPITGVRFAEHVLVVDSGQTLTPAIALLDASGNSVAGATALLSTRNVAVATAGSGTTTGSRSGQTFLVAASADNPSVRDSAVLVVAGAAKPAVTLTMPRFDLKADTTFTVSLIVDSRSSSAGIGAATLQVVWNPLVLSFVSEQAGSANAFVDVNTSAVSTGIATIAIASSSGLTGAAEIRRLTFKASAVSGRTGMVSVDVVDMAAAATFVNLVAQTVSGSYPLRIR